MSNYTITLKTDRAISPICREDAEKLAKGLQAVEKDGWRYGIEPINPADPDSFCFLVSISPDGVFYRS